jgi:hypothetical protein
MSSVVSTCETSNTASDLYYPTRPSEWVQLSTRLKYAELKVLMYLRTLDPFGKRSLKLKVVDLALTLHLHKATVSKALRSLAAQGDIELDLEVVEVRVNYPDQTLPTDNELPTGVESCPQATEVAYRQHMNNGSDLKPSPGKGFKNEKVPIVLKRSKNKKQADPEPNEQEGIGTKELLDLVVAETGIPLNGTIRRTIERIKLENSAAAARQWVLNAASAVVEQMEGGEVRKPQALLYKALRDGLTANWAKGQRGIPSEQVSELQTAEGAIDLALVRGDREFALFKLQRLWDEGHKSAIEELIRLRRDWPFSISAEGISHDER